MKKFSYRCMRQDGKKIEETYEAESREDVVAMITSLGYYPLKIEEIKSKEIGTINIGNKVKAKDLSLFCRQMYTMINAGISINNSLSMLSKQVTNKKLQSIISEMEEDVKKGEMVSDSMRKYTDVFPPLLISMVESGEASGNLDEMFRRMADHFEKENKINSKVRSAMIYPIALSIVAVAAVAIIMIFVMPTFKEIFDSEGVELPLITKALIGLSNFMSNHIFLILIILAIIVVSILKFKNSEKGYVFFSKLKLKLPVIKDLTTKTIVSRFTRTLSTLISSGISIVDAMPIVTGVLRNKVAEDEMDKIKERVVKGDGLSAPLKDSPVFPDMLSSMIKIGEESGSLDEMLSKTADFYDEEVENAITTATSMLEPALIVIMGVVIGTIVISIMLPMFDMYTAVA